MDTILDSKKTDLIYQKQLLIILNMIMELRIKLFTEAAILANDGKPKIWSSVTAMIKFLEKKGEKNDDENVTVVIALLKSMKQPIVKLEGNLELKNDFIRVIMEQEPNNPLVLSDE